MLTLHPIGKHLIGRHLKSAYLAEDSLSNFRSEIANRDTTQSRAKSAYLGENTRLDFTS